MDEAASRKKAEVMDAVAQRYTAVIIHNRGACRYIADVMAIAAWKYKAGGRTAAQSTKVTLWHRAGFK